LLASDASLAAESKKNGQYFRTSQAMWWAWEDLNLRLHPYQAYSRDAFMLEERGTASSAVG
jgi:hypothetical protein